MFSKKKQQYIWKLCNSSFTDENRGIAITLLKKMKAVSDVSDKDLIEQMDDFIYKFKKKYKIGTIIISRQFHQGAVEDGYYVSFSVKDSVSSFHTLTAKSLDEAYMKLCLSLFCGAKSGEYKKRGV